MLAYLCASTTLFRMNSLENENTFEAEIGPERILPREAVLAKLREYCDSFRIERELSDENGIYLLEVFSNESGNTMYAYQRAGTFPGNNGMNITSAGTSVRVEFLDWSSYPETLSDYDSFKDTWTKNG